MRAAARWAAEQAAFLVVAAGVLTGVLLVAPAVWTGILVVALAVLLAAVLRIVLPSARAGMLVVRTRWFDALLFLVLGGTALVLDLRLRG